MTIRISDLIDPKDTQNLTYKDVNSSKQHNIPVDTLVELEDGVRLWVVYHGRDCDGTPLYFLCHDKEDIIKEKENFRNSSWTSGYSEEALKIIKKEDKTI